MDSTLFLEVTDLVCLEEPMVEDTKEGLFVCIPLVLILRLPFSVFAFFSAALDSRSLWKREEDCVARFLVCKMAGSAWNCDY